MKSAQHRQQANRLDNREKHREPARVFGNLLAPTLPFFGQLLQLRHGHGEQLHDNRSIDVRSDPHRKDGEFPKSAAGKRVEEHQDVIAVHQFFHGGPVDAGHRDVQSHHEHGEHHEDELDALAQLGQRPRGQQ